MSDIDDLLDEAHDLLEDGQPEEAEAIAQRVIADASASEDQRAEAHGLRLDARLELGDRTATRAALGALEEDLGRDDPLTKLAWGKVLFHEGKFDDALLELQAARKADPRCATCWWWEGTALERLERGAEADKAFREAHRLDRETCAMPIRIRDDELDAIIEETLDGLPEDIRAELDETCAIVRQDFPHPVRVRDEGIDPFLLGECIGTSEHTRRRDHGGYRAVDTGLTEVMVYRRNLESWCRDREELEEEVRTTLLHEIGHALGLDEDGVAALGLE